MPKRSRSSNDARPGAAKKKRSSSTKRYSTRRSAIAAETKYFDTTWFATVDTAADWATSAVPMTSYIQSDGTTVGAYTASALVPSAIGSGYGQVVGSKYLMKQLRLRGEVVSGVSSDGADVKPSVTVRCVLVQDTQPNGVQATGDLVFTDLGNAAQVNYSFQAMAAGNGGRFRILKDKTFLLQPGVAATDGANTNSCAVNSAHFTMSYKPKKPMMCNIKANSATPAVASISDNNIFMLCHASSTSPPLTFAGAARCYYVD